MIDTDEIVEELAETLKCNPGEILGKVQGLLQKIKELADKIDALKEFVNQNFTYHG